MQGKVDEFKSQQQKNEMLALACCRGLLTDVEQLVAQGADVNYIDKNYQRSASHFAACRGELEVLKFLQSKGLDLDKEDGMGRSPLHYASLWDHEGVVKWLLEQGAWIDSPDCNDDSPLHLAARQGCQSVVKRLVRSGAKMQGCNSRGLTPFGEALINGHVFLANVLLQSQADILEKMKGFGYLHVVAGVGQQDSLKWLLEKSLLGVNSTDNVDRNSPLHAAVLSKNTGCVSLLVQHGAVKDIKNAEGKTPIDLIDTQDQAAEEIQNIIQRAKVSENKTSQTSEEETKQERNKDPGHEFSTLSLEEKKNKIDDWATLSQEKLQKTASYLPSEVYGLMQQMLEIRQLLECQRAIIALHNDNDFQEDIRKPWVLDAVEDISKQQDSIERYRDNGEVMGVMEKLRKLREVFLRNGGKRVNLDDLKFNGSATEKAEDNKKQRVLTQALAGTYHVIINKIEDPVHALPQSKASPEELQQQQQPQTDDQEGPRTKWGDIVKQSALQFLIMLALAVVILFVMGLQGMLPWQDAAIRKAVQKSLENNNPPPTPVTDMKPSKVEL